MLEVNVKHGWYYVKLYKPSQTIISIVTFAFIVPAELTNLNLFDILYRLLLLCYPTQFPFDGNLILCCCVAMILSRIIIWFKLKKKT